MSHDLRNPLNAIQMGVELLAGSELSDPQRRILARTDRATHLTEDLLDFTRARAGNGISVTRTPIRLHDVVADYLDELRLAHPARTLVHERGSEGPCVGDARRLAQLVGNLVSNAIAYGEPNAPITVATNERGTCSISVHNLGPPIPSDLQTTMFEPMTRGNSSDGNARSVGLGPFIVREIARAHGGAASVASSADGGTTFRIEWAPPAS